MAQGPSGHHPDLSGTDLPDLRLVSEKDTDEGEARSLAARAGYLPFPDGVNLSGANCNRINFRHAVLRSADFTGADLTEANLTEADARQARFQKAVLSKAVLDEAQLETADFTEVNLENSSFVAARSTRPTSPGPAHTAQCSLARC